MALASVKYIAKLADRVHNGFISSSVREGESCWKVGMSGGFKIH